MIPASRIHPLLVQGIYGPPRRNRRRTRWPASLIAFILGLLTGWVLRGGGAWLP